MLGHPFHVDAQQVVAGKRRHYTPLDGLAYRAITLRGQNLHFSHMWLAFAAVAMPNLRKGSKAVIGMAADINNNALLRELRRPWIIN